MLRYEVAEIRLCLKISRPHKLSFARFISLRISPLSTVQSKNLPQSTLSSAFTLIAACVYRSAFSLSLKECKKNARLFRSVQSTLLATIKLIFVLQHFNILTSVSSFLKIIFYRVKKYSSIYLSRISAYLVVNAIREIDNGSIIVSARALVRGSKNSVLKENRELALNSQLIR